MLLLKSVLDNKEPHTSTTEQRGKFVPGTDIPGPRRSRTISRGRVIHKRTGYSLRDLHRVA
jgi:hypothetical protein